MGTRKNYERTVELELFEAWQACKRPGDSAEIARQYGFSRPVVDRALNIGFVARKEITLRITDFFTERQEEEKNTAARLKKGALLETVNTSEDGN